LIFDFIKKKKERKRMIENILISKKHLNNKNRYSYQFYNDSYLITTIIPQYPCFKTL